MIHLDTCLLVDLQRELARERPGPAFDFLESLADGEVLAVSVHAVCELRAGAELVRQALAAHEDVDRLLSGLLICYPDDRFAMQYARLAPSIRGAHRPSEMDLLIATAALIDDAPLVTRNVKDFSKVPGLRVLKY